MNKRSKILIGVLCLIIVGLVTFIIVNEIASNKKDDVAIIESETNNKNIEKEISNDILNEAEGKENTTEKNEISNNEEQDDKTTNNSTSSTTTMTAVEAIKKALKDDDWVKQNVMMKTDFGGSDLNYEQELSFIALKNNNLVIVEADSWDGHSSQIFLVGYKNGEVKSLALTENPAHNGHVVYSVDANNMVLFQGYVHMGCYDNKYYKISSMNFEEIEDIYSEEEWDNGYTGKIIYEINNVETSEDEYKKAITEYGNKYSCVAVGTELTDANVDKYIK